MRRSFQYLLLLALLTRVVSVYLFRASQVLGFHISCSYLSLHVRATSVQVRTRDYYKLENKPVYRNLIIIIKIQSSFHSALIAISLLITSFLIYAKENDCQF